MKLAGIFDAIIGKRPDFDFDWLALSEDKSRWMSMGKFRDMEYFLDQGSCYGGANFVWWRQKEVAPTGEDGDFSLCCSYLASDEVIFVRNRFQGRELIEPGILKIALCPILEDIRVGASRLAKMYNRKWPPPHVNHGESILAWHAKKSRRLPGFFYAIFGKRPNFHFDWTAPFQGDAAWMSMGKFDDWEYFLNAASCFGDANSVWWIQKLVPPMRQRNDYCLCLSNLTSDEVLFVAMRSDGEPTSEPIVMNIDAVPLLHEVRLGASRLAQMSPSEWPPCHVNHGESILAWHLKKLRR